ncbi:MAG TPA: hypothetical protein VLK89_04195, partial [Solirubrobacterales bacterium]|nr:hypothetical protein [Solirubrobacterales bacterium]
TQLQDVSMGGLPLGCTPGSSLSSHLLSIPEIAIKSDGSFSATTTDEGVLFGVPAKFTYTFSGHFHGYTSAGVARVAGGVREDVTYDNGTKYSCTSSNLSWSAHS